MKRAGEKKSLAKAMIGGGLLFLRILPMLIAVFLLVGLFESFISKEQIASLFGHGAFADMVIGVGVGAAATGQPIVSYIIGGDLLQNGVSLYAVSAFILSWVTLGFTQLPLEWALFGTRFTIGRNLMSLLFAFVTAFFTALTLEWLA